MKEPTIKDLECLIFWPKGTVGYDQEMRVAINLLNLCKEHGFGRIPQMAQQMEEIWRGEEAAIEKMKSIKKEHFDRMREGWEEAFGDKPQIYTEEYVKNLLDS